MPNAQKVLTHPGVMATQRLDLERVKTAGMALFNVTLIDLQIGRAREGERLAELIRERLGGIRKQVLLVLEHLPTILERQRTQLLERLETAKTKLDPQRLEAEMVILAHKAYVAEELNREANTLSSQAIVADTTRCAVELKVLIEQMREQIQNLE